MRLINIKKKWYKQIHTPTNNLTVTFTSAADACPTLGREAVVAETDAFHTDINAIPTVQAASFDSSAVNLHVFQRTTRYLQFS
jgi:hypothetical protein